MADPGGLHPYWGGGGVEAGINEGQVMEAGVVHSSTVSPVVCNTLIIGDSIVHQVSVKNCETRCHSGATVEDINYMLPRPLPTVPHVESLVIHVGANYVKAGKTKQLKSDFSHLLTTLWESGKNFSISGPV